MVKCFWCEGEHEDLIAHTNRMHPGLSARSYDYLTENVKKQVIEKVKEISLSNWINENRTYKFSGDLNYPFESDDGSRCISMGTGENIDTYHIRKSIEKLKKLFERWEIHEDIQSTELKRIFGGELC